jgi:chromosome segregation ATPase
MSIKCEICGKEFRTTQGRRGHMTFVHQMTTTHDPPARLATEQEMTKLEERLEQLSEQVEQLDGLLDSPTDGHLPITEQLGQLTQQLSEQTQQVNKLSEDVEMTQVAKALSDKCLAQLDKVTFQLESLKDAHHKLVAVVNNNSEQLKKSTAMFEGKLGSNERDLHETNKRLDKVEAQLVKDQDTFKSIEQSVNSLKADIVDMRWRALRRPTDNVITLRLTDGRDHRFKEYKSTRGLRKPHKTTTDWISGDKWVDLSEPED